MLPIPASSYLRHEPEKTVLYRAIAENFETFVKLGTSASGEGNALPNHVFEEVYAYLRCGILAHGFTRLRCERCREEKLVAFSCKKRGFCPSCGGKRMNEVAAHLVDFVLPREPIRQWVISFPFSVRYALAYQPKLVTAVLAIFIRIVSNWIVKRARRSGIEGKTGAITFVQRFGGAINLNVHLHSLFLDGVYFKRSERLEYAEEYGAGRERLRRLVPTSSDVDCFEFPALYLARPHPCLLAASPAARTDERRDRWRGNGSGEWLVPMGVAHDDEGLGVGCVSLRHCGDYETGAGVGNGQRVSFLTELPMIAMAQERKRVERCDDS